MYLAAKIGRWSTTEIGRFYNGRDHSTVCHGIQRIQEMRDSDPEVDSLLSELESQLAKHGELSQNDGPIRISDRRYQLNDEDIKRLVDEVTDRLAERMKELLEE